MAVITDDMHWETVAVPITKGVELNTRHRLIDPGTLAKAENVYYNETGGPVKRRGHAAVRLVNDFIPYVSNPPEDNLYGYGLFDTDNLPTGACVYPQCGSIKDIIVYDDKELAWDGWRLFEPLVTGSGRCKTVGATMPTVTTAPLAKVSGAQSFACSADNGVSRVVAYIDTTSGVNEAYAKVYNSVTGTLKFTYHMNAGTNDPVYVRTVSCGNYCHVLVSDSSDTIVRCYTFSNNDNTVTLITSIAATAVDGIFDVWKFDETRFLVVGLNLNIILTWVNANGTVNADSFAPSTAIGLTGVVTNIAVCVHPTTRQIAVLWNTAGGTQYFKRFTEAAVAVTGVSVAIEVSAFATHMAIAPSYIDNVYYLFIDHSTKYILYNKVTDDTVNTSITRYNTRLASKACRVGNVPFVWINNTSPNTTTYQTTYFLFDNLLLPVAKIEYGTAIDRTADVTWLPSM